MISISVSETLCIAVFSRSENPYLTSNPAEKKWRLKLSIDLNKMSVIDEIVIPLGSGEEFFYTATIVEQAEDHFQIFHSHVPVNKAGSPWYSDSLSNAPSLEDAKAVVAGYARRLSTADSIRENH